MTLTFVLCFLAPRPTVIAGPVPERIPPQVSQFLDRVESLPVDYRADLQLNALESQKTGVRVQYWALIRRLYSDLTAAANPYPLGYAANGRYTLERILGGASAYTKLDALTLRMRALHVAFPIDSLWATEQLKQTHLSLPAAGCTEALVPDVSTYYETVTDFFFQRGRTAPFGDILWLGEHIRNLSSPLPLTDIAVILAHVNASKDDLDFLTLQFEATLQRLRATDRELGWLTHVQSMTALQFPEAISALLERLRHDGVREELLLASYRQFLMNSLSNERCLDSITDWPAIQTEFNDLVEKDVRSTPIQHITMSDVAQQTGSGTRANEHPLPDSDESESILTKMYLMRIERTPLVQSLSGFGDSQHTSAWDSYSKQLIELADGLDVFGAPCTECVWYFREKVLLDGFDLVPEGPAAKNKLMEAVVEQLARDPTKLTQPLLWGLQMKIVLNLARPVAKAQADQLKKLSEDQGFIPFAPSPMHEEIREYLRQTNNEILNAYLSADLLFSNTFSAPYLN